MFVAACSTRPQGIVSGRWEPFGCCLACCSCGGLAVGVPEAWSPCIGLAKGRSPGIGLAKGRPPGGGVPKNWPCTEDRVGVGSTTKRGRPRRGRYP